MEAWRLIMLLTLVGSLSSAFAEVCAKHGEDCMKGEPHLPHRMKRGLRVKSLVKPAAVVLPSASAVIGGDVVNGLPIAESIAVKVPSVLEDVKAVATPALQGGISMSSDLKDTVDGAIGTAIDAGTGLPAGLQFSADGTTAGGSGLSAGAGLIGSDSSAVTDLVSDVAIPPINLNTDGFMAALKDAHQTAADVSTDLGASIVAPKVDASVSAADRSDVQGTSSAEVGIGALSDTVGGLTADLSGSLPAVAPALSLSPPFGLGLGKARSAKSKAKAKSNARISQAAPEVRSGGFLGLDFGGTAHTQVQPPSEHVAAANPLATIEEDVLGGGVLGGFGSSLESVVGELELGTGQLELGATGSGETLVPEIGTTLLGVESLIPGAVSQVEADLSGIEHLPEVEAGLSDVGSLVGGVEAAVSGIEKTELTAGLSGAAAESHVGTGEAGADFLLPEVEGALISDGAAVATEVEEVEAEIPTVVETVVADLVPQIVKPRPQPPHRPNNHAQQIQDRKQKMQELIAEFLLSFMNKKQ